MPIDFCTNLCSTFHHKIIKKTFVLFGVKIGAIETGHIKQLISWKYLNFCELIVFINLKDT